MYSTGICLINSMLWERGLGILKQVPLYTQEPLNNGHAGTSRFVHCREVVFSSEVKMYYYYRQVHYWCIEKCPLGSIRSVIGGSTTYSQRAGSEEGSDGHAQVRSPLTQLSGSSGRRLPALTE